MRKLFRQVQRQRDLTDIEVKIVENLEKEWKSWTNMLMAIPDLAEDVARLTAELTATETAKEGKSPARLFPDMIKEWEAYCVKANVNYIALNTEFPAGTYQAAINAKPLFIKRVLDAVAPRSVLYIDGDMWMLKYPHLFDIDGVDFMARGWNIDSRSKPKSLKRPAFDPYIFETSGGTMYFANTQAARNLLDEWSSASLQQPGKADDRILSQVFTKNTMILETNIINLPIEYLWLTDNYKEYLKSAADPASVEDAFIEHYYCLTGEERAADQEAAANREPVGYEEEITDMINYKREPELFYEYIFFNADKQKREGFARYLKYMSTATNHWTKKPMMTIVGFDAKYGEFNAIAEKNLKDAKIVVPVPDALPGMGSVARVRPDGIPRKVFAGGAVPLPLDTPIPTILSTLSKGTDVHLGETLDHGPEYDCVAYDVSTREDGINEYTRKLRVDTTKPMFFSAKSSVIFHLLAMCETLSDINKHINGSYLFLSRIRWKLLKPGTIPPINYGIEFRPVVHQIWFGGEMPLWRQKIFSDNEAVCRQNGFAYKLWRNADREAIEMKRGEDGALKAVLDDKGKTVSVHFPQTYAYQQTALHVGRETGQSRWAQVADLARLEIVYNNGGIYVDSIIEISPAFLLAVVNAINGGATFVTCNEDACDRPEKEGVEATASQLDCKNSKGEMYLSNSFFAAVEGSPLFKHLLTFDSLDGIDFENPQLNHTTGPYFLRAGVEAVKKDLKIFMFDSEQLYMYNKQETPYKDPHPDRFITLQRVPGGIKFADNPPVYYNPGGIKVLQSEFLGGDGTMSEFDQMVAVVERKGPLAIYHSGLGGTWSL